MTSLSRRSFRVSGWLLLLSLFPGPHSGQGAESKPYTDWRDYGGSPDSMQYSALSQVNKTNVQLLKPVWFRPYPGQAIRLVFNPLVIDGVMYVQGSDRTIVALNAASGEELWTHTVAGGSPTSRGIAYWESKDRSDRRLVFTAGGAIRQIDARTGEAVTSFGDAGRVTLRRASPGNPRMLGGPNSTPPRIFENLMIVGSNTGEGYGSPPGDIRAFDILTGELVWTFRTVPMPGDFGHDTYENPEAWLFVGGNNVWGEMTVDEKNGIVFCPTGSPTHDLYGADRAGDNLFGNSLVALDARTGKRLWHFQTVHHDLWDYDLASSPNLLTVRHNGEMVDVVSQAGKTGFLYVFKRLTGEPLWPIEERPVPRSEVPGEVSSPTQPFPTKPPPFARQKFGPEDVNPFVSEEEQERLREAVRSAASEGVFTPSSHLRHHIQFPGAWGGANWGSTAADPEKGMIFVRSLEMPSYRRMSGGPAGQGRGGRGGRGAAAERSPLEEVGLSHYMRLCSACHGQGQIPMKAPAAIGIENFRAVVRQGREQMPPFPEEVLSAEALGAMEAYFAGLAAARAASAGADVEEERSGEAPLPLPGPPRYAGPPVRYSGSFSAGWYTTHGMPAVGPPWTQLVAYDLNEGVIKWSVPDGYTPGLAEQGITNTGSVRPRNGPVATAGGLVFIANSQDRHLRAFDRETGAVLWEYELEANPEGIPAVYEVDGRQYLVFGAGASWGTGSDPVWRNAFHRKEGKIEAQGYHVFALPEASGR